MTINWLTNDTTHDTLMKVLYDIMPQHADEYLMLCDAKCKEKDRDYFDKEIKEKLISSRCVYEEIFGT